MKDPKSLFVVVVVGLGLIGMVAFAIVGNRKVRQSSTLFYESRVDSFLSTWEKNREHTKIELLDGRAFYIWPIDSLGTPVSLAQYGAHPGDRLHKNKNEPFFYVGNHKVVFMMQRVWAHSRL